VSKSRRATVNNYTDVHAIIVLPRTGAGKLYSKNLREHPEAVSATGLQNPTKQRSRLARGDAYKSQVWRGSDERGSRASNHYRHPHNSGLQMYHLSAPLYSAFSYEIRCGKTTACFGDRSRNIVSEDPAHSAHLYSRTARSVSAVEANGHRRSTVTNVWKVERFLI